MSTAIPGRIVRIGNSRGVRLPKVLLELSGLGEEVEFVVDAGEIRIRKRRKAREGWEQSFAEMAANGDDGILFGEDLLTSIEGEEWTWPTGDE